jgi:copper/silver efflux system protein
VDFEPDRAAMERYGLTIGEIHLVLESAVGGMPIATTVQGRERYSVNVRYPRELRDNLEALERVLVATPAGAQIPLIRLGDLRLVSGPGMLLNEDGSLVGYVYVDLEERDPGSYVAEARALIGERVSIPPGYFLVWTGQYEHLERMRSRMALVLPLTLAIIFGLLYASMRSVAKTLLIMLSVPLSLIGGIIYLFLLDYNTSAAVWAGAIALMGVAVETTSIMMVFLDQAWRSYQEKADLRDLGVQREAILEGARQCLRPVLMAVSTNFFGLVPAMIAVGIGADVMRRIAAPMFGGLITLLLLTLVITPILYRQMASRQVRGEKRLNQPTF